MLTVFAVNIMVITTVVIIHYEFMYRFTLLMPHMKIRHRFLNSVKFPVYVCRADQRQGRRVRSRGGAHDDHPHQLGRRGVEVRAGSTADARYVRFSLSSPASWVGLWETSVWSCP